MNTSLWIAALRRRISAFSTVASLTAMAFSHSAAVAEEPIVTRVGRFQLPFDVDAEPGEQVEGFAVLFGSQDGGQTWEQLQSVPASQGQFTFNAPRDGRYSFAIRVADAQGNLSAAQVQGAQPEMEVIVDTVAPELKLELFDSSPGQIIVSWTCTDLTADPETLAIEFSDAADGRWKPVQLQPAVNGQAMITVSSGRAISVRGMICDAAGNRADSTAQITTRMGTAGTSAMAGTATPSRAAVPLGPSPFNGGAKGGDSVGLSDPVMVSPGSPPAVPQIPMNPSFSSDVTRPAPVGAGQSNVSVSTPMTSSVGAAPAGVKDALIVNSSMFDIDYSVEDVGPSGVSAVELFVTEDGGQNWFRYGLDSDLKSPFSVDTLGEGTFGFAVRVRNGLGFVETPPQPGQAPDMTDPLDTSSPQIEIAPPAV
ncbi:MAG: hypothetical protein ACK58L_02225, partial [Planctomycetota bacterium]